MSKTSLDVYSIIAHIPIMQNDPNTYPDYWKANGKPRIPAPIYDLNKFIPA